MSLFFFSCVSIVSVRCVFCVSEFFFVYCVFVYFFVLCVNVTYHYFCVSIFVLLCPLYIICVFVCCACRVLRVWCVLVCLCIVCINDLWCYVVHCVSVFVWVFPLVVGRCVLFFAAAYMRCRAFVFFACVHNLGAVG